jgi:alpha/beta superfamily hydrolase
VSGSRDQFGPPGKLEALVNTFADPKKLVRIEAGDHFFEGRLRELRDTIEAVGERDDKFVICDL